MDEGNSLEANDSNLNKKRHCNTNCVAGSPSKTSCTNTGDTPGITMHCFPKDTVVRQKWVRFVCLHLSDFEPAQYSRKIFLCSAHFEESCFTKRFAGDLEGFDSDETKRFLSRESVPTIDVAGTASMAEKKQISAREKRMVSTNMKTSLFLLDGIPGNTNTMNTYTHSSKSYWQFLIF